LLETVLTLYFVLVIQGATRDGGPTTMFAPIAIGFVPLQTRLVAIPIDNATVDLYRSSAPAPKFPIWTSSHWAIVERWFFIVAPTAGRLTAAAVDPILSPPSKT
jgi:glycerol uptake facilitator-like aquaporin